MAGTSPETNARLYSIDRAGRRGVVFRSLESPRFAVALRRRGAGLEYTLVAAAGLPGVVERAPESVLYSAGPPTVFGRPYDARRPLTRPGG